MEAPDRFVSTLERQFRGRLRLRWSTQFNKWQIEQRMGRGVFETPYRRETDAWHRAKDGYSFVMSFSVHDYMHCPFCNGKLPLPICETAEVKCSKCCKVGQDARFRGCYFPLNDRLITHLSSIDPERANIAQEQCDAADLANARAEALRHRTTYNQIEAATHDHWRSMVGIQGTGYTGKVFKGN